MKNKPKETSPQGRSKERLKLHIALSKTAPYKNGPGHKEQANHYPYIERSEAKSRYLKASSLMSTIVEGSRRKAPPRTNVRGLQNIGTCLILDLVI